MTTNPNVRIDTTGMFASLLAVLFIGLKLTGHITWSWWWVLAPLWGPLALVLTIFAVLGIVLLITKIADKP